MYKYENMSFCKTGSSYPSGLDKAFLETAHFNMSMDAPDLISAGGLTNTFWKSFWKDSEVENRMVLDAIPRAR